MAFGAVAFAILFIASVIHVKEPQGLDTWLAIAFFAAVLLLPTLAVVVTDNPLAVPLVLVSANAGLCVGDFFPYAMNWWGLDVDSYNSSSDAPGVASLWFRLFFVGFFVAIFGFVAGFVEWLAVRFVRALVLKARAAH